MCNYKRLLFPEETIYRAA